MKKQKVMDIEGVTPYLNEDNMINSLWLFIWPLGQIFENIFEVGDKDIFHEVFVLFNVVIFQVNLIVHYLSLLGEIVTLCSNLGGNLS